MKICFVALHAYPVFNPKAKGVFGGLETHAWTLATELATREGFEVSFVVDHPDARTGETLQNVRIISRWSFMESVRDSVSSHADIYHRPPFIKLRRWSFHLLWQIPFLILTYPWNRFYRRPPCEAAPFFTSLDADIFLCFGVNSVASEVVASARAASKKTILILESNSELDARYEAETDFVSEYGEQGSVCHFAISQVDQIVSQTEYQLELLTERFQRSGPVITNPIDVSRWNQLSENKNSSLEELLPSQYVLWIGRADRFHKRPHLCLEIAKKLPDVHFLMILNPNDRTVDEEIRSQAPANVSIITQVPFREMPILFSKAKIFFSTGSLEYEGAPNVFQQASASGIPIASLDVGHDWIDEANCGYIANGSMETLAKTIATWWKDKNIATTLGENGKMYVEQSCSPEEKVNQLIELFKTQER